MKIKFLLSDQFQKSRDVQSEISEGKLEEIILPATKRFSKRVGILPKVTFKVFLNKDTLPGLGFGVDPGLGNTVKVWFDPDSPRLKGSVKRNLPGFIAHELSHLFRYSKLSNKENRTPKGALVNEGVATYIEKRLYPKTKDPHRSLTKIQERRFRAYALKNLDGPYNYFEWFHGKGKWPYGAGYQLGYHLVEDYVRQNRGIKLPDLCLISPEEVLKNPRMKLEGSG